MHKKTLKKALLFSVALSSVTPNIAFAAEPAEAEMIESQSVGSETQDIDDTSQTDSTMVTEEQDDNGATSSGTTDVTKEPDASTSNTSDSKTEETDTPNADDTNPGSDATDSSDSVSEKEQSSEIKQGDESSPETTPEQTENSINVTIIPTASTVNTAKKVSSDFRFWTTVKKYAFAKEQVSVREEKDDKSREIGVLHWKNVCYILEDKDDGWVYVESGDVRGFVKKSSLFVETDAQTIVKSYQKIADEKSNKENSSIDYLLHFAEKKVENTDNKAFSYLKSTTSMTVIPKEYALVNASLLNIREGKGTDSRIIGTLPQGALCYIIADKDTDWVYIESGDVRGFVYKDYINTGDEVKAHVESAGEDTFSKATKEIEPADNKALYYTLTSIKSGISSNAQGTEIVRYAQQFIGNPYVWGGTSLTDGADCSGFVQQVYKNFNIDLPRVAEDQAQVGSKIPVNDAQPGDLIFYADESGYIYHVVIYAGDGKTVEAMNEENGIVEGNVLNGACWATRLTQPEANYDSIDIGEVTEETWDYLRAAGYSQVQTSSIMANIWAESHFNPSIEEYGNGIGFGLCQWSYGRRTNLENFAASKGKAASDLEVQLEFLISELNLAGFNGNEEYYNTWCTTSDVNEATKAFLYGWERPGVPRLEERLQAANVYYNAYRNK